MNGPSRSTTFRSGRPIGRGRNGVLDELDSFVDSEPQGWSPLRAAQARNRDNPSAEDPGPDERREPAFAKRRRPAGSSGASSAASRSGASERVDAFTKRLDEQLARPSGEAAPPAPSAPPPDAAPSARRASPPPIVGEPDVVPQGTVETAAQDTPSRRIPPAPPVEALVAEPVSEKVDVVPDVEVPEVELPEVDFSDDEPADALDWELNHAIGAIVSGQALTKEPEVAATPLPDTPPLPAVARPVVAKPVVSDRKAKPVPTFNFERREEVAEPSIPTDTDELIDSLYFPDARSALDAARPVPEGDAEPLELEAGDAEFVYDDVEPASSEFDEPARRARRQRGGGVRSVGIAAAVACIAILGVAGVVGFNVFAGGSTGSDDGPPIIRADARDVKVRVDNSTPQAEPDIMQRTAVRDNGRLVQETVTIPAAREAFPEESEEPLTRRRVQTVVVRPDGTLVPAASAARDAAARRTASAESLGVPAVRAAEDVVSDGAEAPVEEPVRVAAVDPLATIGTRTVRDVSSEPEPTATTAPAELPATEEPLSADLGPAPEEPLGPSAIGIPRKRPADLPAAVSSPPPSAGGPVDLASQRAAETAVSTPAREPAPTQAGLSPWAVQVSSQRSRADAERSFRSLQQRYSSILGGVDPLILQANVPGRGVFYRVRIAADSRGEAAELCQQLKAAGADCFIGRN